MPRRRAEVDERAQDRHVLVQAAVFGQVAEVARVGPGGLAVAQAVGDGAAVGPEDAEQHADEAGLAGPVRPEQGEHLAGLDGERHAVDGLHRGVALRHVLDGQDRHSTPQWAVGSGQWAVGSDEPASSLPTATAHCPLLCSPCQNLALAERHHVAAEAVERARKRRVRYREPEAQQMPQV